jgi:hypothetical protein
MHFLSQKIPDLLRSCLRRCKACPPRADLAPVADGGIGSTRLVSIERQRAQRRESGLPGLKHRQALIARLQCTAANLVGAFLRHALRIEVRESNAPARVGRISHGFDRENDRRCRHPPRRTEGREPPRNQSREQEQNATNGQQKCDAQIAVAKA